MWKRSAFVRAFPQSLQIKGVNAKLSCERSLEIWMLKMWKRSFRARRPSKSERWRCESEAFVRDIPQNQTTLKMWKRSFRARLPSKSESWRCECEAFVRDFCLSKSACWKCKNEAFVQDIPQSLKAEDLKAKLSCETSLKVCKLKMWQRSFRAGLLSLKVWKLKMWKRSFRARHLSKSASWRCENKAFVRDIPQSLQAEDEKNGAFVRAFLQSLQAEDVKTKLSCETSLRVCKLKMWQRSFRARLPSKSASWRCESKPLVRDFPQSLKAEDVKRKLSCETSFKIWKLKMWMRSFRAKCPSKPERWRCENEAFVRDSPQILQAEDVKTNLSFETSLKVCKLKMWKRTFPARHPSKSASWRCENAPFVRDFPQSLKAEDVKTNLSCETPFKVWKLKMWKRSFRARIPSKSERWRCENEAFVRDIPQSLKAKDAKAKLSCETAPQFWELKMWKRSCRGRLLSKSESWRCESEAIVRGFCLSKSASWKCENKAFLRDVPQCLKAEDVKDKLSCERSLKVCKLKMWKQSFHARRPSKSESWRCESEAFVRDIPQSLQAEDVKTNLSYETSLKVCKLKRWQRSFRARHPSKSKRWRCESEAFVHHFPQSLKAEDVKAKLLCETSLKIGTLKMWKRSFRPRHPSKSERWRCENQAFVRDIPQSLKAKDVKAKLLCETSLKVWKLKLWKPSFRARGLSKSECWRCANEAFVRDVPQ